MVLRRGSLLALSLITACGSASPSTSTDAGVGNAQVAPAPASAMLAARTLSCVLGRATNLDPSKQQSTKDIIYEGRHEFALFLPAIPVRQGPPPDPGDPAEPVDPRTRVLSDPTGLMRGVPPRFDRVADLWPARVELLTVTRPPVARLIIISSIDEHAGTASLFMTDSVDAATLDLDHVFQGNCTIKSERA